MHHVLDMLTSCISACADACGVSLTDDSSSNRVHVSLALAREELITLLWMLSELLEQHFGVRPDSDEAAQKGSDRGQQRCKGSKKQKQNSRKKQKQASRSGSSSSTAALSCWGPEVSEAFGCVSEALMVAGTSLCDDTSHRFFCNSPWCENMSGVSAAFQLVRGRACVCGGCLGNAQEQQQQQATAGGVHQEEDGVYAAR